MSGQLSWVAADGVRVETHFVGLVQVGAAAKQWVMWTDRVKEFYEGEGI